MISFINKKYKNYLEHIDQFILKISNFKNKFKNLKNILIKLKIKLI